MSKILDQNPSSASWKQKGKLWTVPWHSCKRFRPLFHHFSLFCIVYGRSKIIRWLDSNPDPLCWPCHNHCPLEVLRVTQRWLTTQSAKLPLHFLCCWKCAFKMIKVCLLSALQTFWKHNSNSFSSKLASSPPSLPHNFQTIFESSSYCQLCLFVPLYFCLILRFFL